MFKVSKNFVSGDRQLVFLSSSEPPNGFFIGTFDSKICVVTLELRELRGSFEELLRE